MLGGLFPRPLGYGFVFNDFDEQFVGGHHEETVVTVFFSRDRLDYFDAGVFHAIIDGFDIAIGEGEVVDDVPFGWLEFVGHRRGTTSAPLVGYCVNDEVYVVYAA